MRQSPLPKIYAVSRTKGTPEMPGLIADAVASGHTVQLVVPREKRWKITRRDGVAFFYWAGTERWFSARIKDNVQGYTQDGLRHWLGLQKQAA